MSEYAETHVKTEVMEAQRYNIFRLGAQDVVGARQDNKRKTSFVVVT